jgi:hypothetical protein
MNADVVKDHLIMELQVDPRVDHLVGLQMGLQVGLQEDLEPLRQTVNAWNFPSAEMTGLAILTQR